MVDNGERSGNVRNVDRAGPTTNFQDWKRRFLMEWEAIKVASQHLSEETKRLIDHYLDTVEGEIRNLDILADAMEGDGFPMAASVVRDSMDYLRDISWLDFVDSDGNNLPPNILGSENVDNVNIVGG